MSEIKFPTTDDPEEFKTFCDENSSYYSDRKAVKILEELLDDLIYEERDSKVCFHLYHAIKTLEYHNETPDSPGYDW